MYNFLARKNTESNKTGSVKIGNYHNVFENLFQYEKACGNCTKDTSCSSIFSTYSFYVDDARELKWTETQEKCNIAGESVDTFWVMGMFKLKSREYVSRVD